ncbi:hypothetical protein PRIPAC_87900 [Pristionchus pacificus]|uniref:Uncharacterized protein n=1 Tax=Pristionchus pacificus TaxID=54126 RepID=A0A2A6B9L0_PRIPA|nr:hypothetical protein PRIPAC_87900 [Pristionchus pacificus]|eukprot:PDM62554.1 hypothetical protein PRIPAC_51996 [Pristionchus pacificus]
MVRVRGLSRNKDVVKPQLAGRPINASLSLAGQSRRECTANGENQTRMRPEAPKLARLSAADITDKESAE